MAYVKTPVEDVILLSLIPVRVSKTVKTVHTKADNHVAAAVEKVNRSIILIVIKNTRILF